MQLPVFYENAVTKTVTNVTPCNGIGAITNLISPVLRVKIVTPIIQEMSTPVVPDHTRQDGIHQLGICSKSRRSMSFRIPGQSRR
jgi:hypothetical protein